MIKNFFLIFFLLTFAVTSDAFVNDDKENSDEEFISIETGLLRNPFKSQLPVPEKTLPIPGYENQESQEGSPDLIQQSRKLTEGEVKVQEPVLPKLIITGLIWNSERPQAIVNGEVVDIGEKVLDLEIRAIKKTGIDVNFMGKIVTINP